LAVRVLVSGATDPIESGVVAGASLRLEEAGEYRDVVEVMRELPRKDRLKTHPDW
jgi:hypothetical protein